MRWLFLLVCCTLLPAAGCSQPDLPPLDQWITFDSPDAPYTVLFPQQPKRKEKSAAGVNFIIHQYMVNPDYGLLAGHNESTLNIDIHDDEVVQELLGQMISAVTLAKKLEITEQFDSTIQGKFPYRQVTATAKLPDGRAICTHLRIILTPTTIIQISVVGTTNEMQNRQSIAFIDSIRIKD